MKNTNPNISALERSETHALFVDIVETLSLAEKGAVQ